jgi:hypothetical protein
MKRGSTPGSAAPGLLRHADGNGSGTVAVDELDQSDDEGGTMPVTFDEVVEKIGDAARRVEADAGASPVLAAVVKEFESKLAKAQKRGADGAPTRDSVIELEQAGDSAKAAAEADGGLSDGTREAVLGAHLAICQLKAGA